MKTKAQKIKDVETGTEAFRASKTLVFADYTGSTVEELKKLRRSLRESGSKFTVMKKRLITLMFKNLGIDLDARQYKGQVGAVTAPRGISDIAGVVYRFSKEAITADKKEKFKILGGYDLAGKLAISADDVKAIGMLPPRDVLLGQLLGTFSGPMRVLLNILDQKSKKSN